MDLITKEDCLSVDSPPSKGIDFNGISVFSLKAIQKVSHANHKIEICGIGNNKKLFFLKNISKTPKVRFEINPSDYFKILKNATFLFHSHCCGSAVPSEVDIFAAEEACLDSLIYSVPERSFSLYSSKFKKSIYFSLE
jgi:proteasome lid subunit RPN8/RPN11